MTWHIDQSQSGYWLGRVAPVWLALTCGCFLRLRAPPCFGRQTAIDAWFDARRDTVAAQMETKNDV